MKPLARNEQILTEQLGAECIVYDMRSKKAHTLNPTSTWIWQHCDGSMSIEDMAVRFQQEFACGDASELVVSGLQQLRAADLLVSSSEAQPGEPMMTRRSVVAAGSAAAPF